MNKPGNSQSWRTTLVGSVLLSMLMLSCTDVAHGEVVCMSPEKTDQISGTLMAIIDLQGQPRTLDLRSLDGKTGLKPKGTEAQPAQLLRATETLNTGEQRDTWIICSLERTPHIYWKDVTRLIRADGGGYDSFTLSLVRPPKGDKWLEIHLLQSTVPGAKDRVAMPGPPLVLRYVFKGKRYDRIK